MKKNIFISLLLAGLLGVSNSASAGVYCYENVTQVVLHMNGNYYFATDKTCQSWCQLKWSAESNKAGYAMLLSAKLTEKPLFFYWPDLAVCSGVNVTYASPSEMTVR